MAYSATGFDQCLEAEPGIRDAIMGRLNLAEKAVLSAMTRALWAHYIKTQTPGDAYVIKTIRDSGIPLGQLARHLRHKVNDPEQYVLDTDHPHYPGGVDY